MATYDEAVNEICTNAEWRKMCKRMAGKEGLHDDLYQEFIEVVLRYDKDKILTMYNEISKSGHRVFNFWAIRVLSNMWYSNTSPFYNMFRKPLPKIDVSAYDHNYYMDHCANEFHRLRDEIGRFKSDPHWMGKRLWELRQVYGSYRAVERATAEIGLRIPFKTAQAHVKAWEEEIKNRANDCEDCER